MSLTQRVESINAIVHKYVNSHFTLMELFNDMQKNVILRIAKG